MQSWSRGLRKEIISTIKENVNILRIIQPVSYTDIYSIPWITRQNEMEAWENSQTSLGGIWTTEFCALHSYQSKDGAKKPQADGRDHEATAHLNISYATENEKCNSGLLNTLKELKVIKKYLSEFCQVSVYMSHLLCSYQIFQRSKEIKKLTVQGQHWRKVLAIGHTSGISHTCFPQVGPKGCCGDDCPVHRGHLPVVCRQSWGNEDPTWDRQEKCNYLGCHFAHVLWVLMGPEFESVCRSFS